MAASSDWTSAGQVRTSFACSAAEEEEADERLTEISESLLDAVGEMEGSQEEEEGAAIGEEEEESPIKAGQPKTKKSSGM